MVRANVQGTGIYATNGVRQLIGLRWRFKPADSGSITTPIVSGSTAYFGLRGTLYAVDTASGTEKWNRQLDNQSTSAPAVASDTVYVGGWEELYAISTDTGGVRWSFQPAKGSDDSYYLDPVVSGGTVYFTGWKSLYAVDSETGREKWKVALRGVTITVPTVYSGTIYVGTYTPDRRETTYLYALGGNTGQEKWKRQATGGGIGGAVAATNGVLYVGTLNDGLLALDAGTGQEKWRYNPGTGIATAPAVAYGIVYVTNRGTLYALDAQTGKEKWRLQAGGDLPTDPVIAEGIVYFGSSTVNVGVLFGGKPSGDLHAVDAQSGQELWKYTVEGSISRTPSVADGTIYFGTDEGTLYAVK